MMIRTSLFCLILVLGFSGTTAQENRSYVDSLLNYLEDDPSVKVDDYALIDRVCAEAEAISKSIGYPDGLFRANLFQAQVYRDFSDEKVEPTIARLEDLMEESADDISSEYIMEYYLVRGYINGKKGLFLDELNDYLKADSICKHAPLDPSLHLYVEQHLAMYYFTQEDYDNARIIFENIIEEQEALGIPNPRGYALYNFNLGVIHKHLGNTRKARSFIQKGIELGSSEYKDALFQYTMLAETYVQTNDLDSSEIYLKRAAGLISDDNKISIDLVDFYTVSSHYHFQLQDYQTASKYASRAIQLSDSLNFVSGAMEGHEWRVKSVLAASPIRGGEDDFAMLMQLRDSLNNRNSLELEKKYLVQYRTLEQEALARQKQAENDQLQLENELYKRSLLFYAALTFALFVILFLAIRRYRIKRKLVQKELEVSELEKQKIQSDLRQREKELEMNIDLLYENTKKMETLKASSQKAESIQQIQEIFENNYIQENQWDNIILQFESIHPEYMEEMKSSDQDFTRNDLKMAILDKLGYSNQSMQEILNISYEGVKKAKQRFNRKRNSEA